MFGAKKEQMKIVYRKISELIPAEYNPRKITDKEMEDLKESFVKLGTLEPAVINQYLGRENIIISGHQRIKVAIELGMEEYPCYEVSFDPEKEKEANIRMNKNGGGWDFKLLEDNFSLGDLRGWGFTDMELNIGDRNVKGKTGDDDVPEPPKEATTISGQLFKLGEHRLLCGSSTNMNAVRKLMMDENADMVFTDPPYGIDYQSNMRVKSEKFDKIKNDDSFITEWIPAINLFNKGFVFVWTSWKVLAEWLEITKPIGELSNMIIWDKGGGGIGDLEKTFSTDFEIALVFNQGNKLTGKRIGSVWDCSKDKPVDYKHPTQKPVELAEIAIKSVTNENNSVLDLFGGSGSTLIACEKTDRKCRMMELDPIYCDVIIKRWEDFTGKKAELIK